MRSAAGIIIYFPCIRQRFVSRFKIFPAATESSQNISARNIVATLFHADSDAAQRQLHGGQPQKNNFNSIASRFPAFNPADIGQTAQRAFKGKILPGLGQTIQFAKKQPTGIQRGKLRFQRRQAGGQQIGVHEMNHTRILRQKFARKSCFSRTVRTGDDDAARRTSF